MKTRPPRERGHPPTVPAGASSATISDTIPAAWQEPLDGVGLLWLILAVTLFLLLLGRLDIYSHHLNSDSALYYQRVHEYIDLHTLNGGDYPPGTLYYFILIRWLEHSSISFLDGLQLCNCILLALNLAWLNKLGGRVSAIGAGVLFAMAGPISLYRFDLLASLLVLLAWRALTRSRPLLAGLLLGYAVMVKVYPILLLPLFAMCGPPTAWRRVVGGAFGAILAVLAIFEATGGHLIGTVNTLAFHGSSPVSQESTFGVILQLLQDLGATVLINVDVRGFAIDKIIRVPASFPFVFAVAAVWWFAWRARPYAPERVLAYASSALASMLFLDVLFQPQYMLWMVALLSLIYRAGVPWQTYLGLLQLLGLTVLAQQYVFPLHYSEYLAALEAHHLASDWRLAAFLYATKILFLLYYVAVQRAIWKCAGPASVATP